MTCSHGSAMLHDGLPRRNLELANPPGPLSSSLPSTVIEGVNLAITHNSHERTFLSLHTHHLPLPQSIDGVFTRVEILAYKNLGCVQE